MRAGLFALAAAALALLLPATASAHRGHSSLSVVEIDPRTGEFTVEHRMAAHDVEPMLVSIAPDAQPSLDDPEALAALRAYGGRAFRVWPASGAPAALTFVDDELVGDNVRLRYRGRLPTPVTAVRVDSDIGEETHDDQENQVNVRVGGVTRTVLFHRGSGSQAVTFGG